MVAHQALVVHVYCLHGLNLNLKLREEQALCLVQGAGPVPGHDRVLLAGAHEACWCHACVAPVEACRVVHRALSRFSHRLRQEDLWRRLEG